jgi:hypothetical protein
VIGLQELVSKQFDRSAKKRSEVARQKKKINDRDISRTSFQVLNSEEEEEEEHLDASAAMKQSLEEKQTKIFEAVFGAKLEDDLDA